MQVQLTFLSSFIEDLLDLRQLKDGVFSLSTEVFDPIETFELMCSTFEPQAAAKKININFEVSQVLLSPDELNNIDNSLDQPAL